MTVTRDATSGLYRPANATEWTELLAGSGISNPTSMWLCQEASGNLADSIGSGTLVKSGAPTYQNTVSGHASKAVICRDGTTDIFNWASPNASCLAFAYLNFPASTGGTRRSVLTHGGSFGHQVALDLKISSNPTKPTLMTEGDTGTDGTSSVASAVHPVLLQTNKTATTAVVQTDLETISHSQTASSSMGNFALGGDNTQFWTSAGVGYLYVAFWTGSAAELDATARATLLSRLANGPPGLQCPSPISMNVTGLTAALAVSLAAASPSTLVLNAGRSALTFSLAAPAPIALTATPRTAALSLGLAADLPPTLTLTPVAHGALTFALAPPTPTALALAGQTSSLSTGLGVGTATLTLTPAAPPTMTLSMVAPTPTTLTMTPNAASLAADLAAPAPATITLTPRSAALSLALAMVDDPTVLTLTGHFASTNRGLNVPSAASLVFTGQAASVLAGTQLFAPSPIALTFASVAPTLGTDLRPTLTALGLTGLAATLFVQTSAGQAFGGLLNNITRFSTAALDGVTGYSVVRTEQGTYDAHGEFTAGAQSRLTIDASIQPYSGRGLRVLPEGTRSEDIRVIYTGIALQVMTPATAPDAITIAGETFVVFKVDGPFNMSGISSYRAYAARQVIP